MAAPLFQQITSAAGTVTISPAAGFVSTTFFVPASAPAAPFGGTCMLVADTDTVDRIIASLTEANRLAKEGALAA